MLRTILFLLVIATLISCNDNFNSSIPDAPVNFTCSLVQAPYVQITTPNQFFTVEKTNKGFAGITSSGQSVSGSKIGFYFGYAGIIVGNSTFNGYCSFDLSCPYEYKQYNRKTAVDLQTDNSGKAVCPNCKSEYDLNNGGIPVKGVSKERLKPYNVYLNGDQSLTVRK